MRITRHHRPLLLPTSLFMLLAFCAACEEPEPPPPSDPPTISSPDVTCGAPSEAMKASAAYEEYDLPVVLAVSVMIEDPQRDLLPASVKGEINGFPIPSLTDDDADLRYVWTPPSDRPPIACKGEMIVRFEASDQDGNDAELTEILNR